MNKGKLLEKKCKDLFTRKNLWHHRFYDSHSAGKFLPPQPADFLLIINQHPIFIECKESEKDLIPFSNFRPSQLKAMRELTKMGINYYVVVLYKKVFYYLFTGKEILEMLNLGKKSISIIDKIGNTSLDGLFSGSVYK